MRAENLAILVEKLNDEFVENFDPVRFALIQSSLKRLNQLSRKTSDQYLEKLVNSAQQYLSDYERYRSSARELRDLLAVEFPKHLKQIDDLFETCRFIQLQQLSEKLSIRRQNRQRLSLLRDLTDSIREASDSSAHEQKISLDDLLTEQEQRNRQEVANDTNPRESVRSAERSELRSTKQFAESKKRHDIENIITKAINQGPESPGPLNPQMLAINSILQMRELSPEYLRRFTVYIETLLWLEKNAIS